MSFVSTSLPKKPGQRTNEGLEMSELGHLFCGRNLQEMSARNALEGWKKIDFSSLSILLSFHQNVPVLKF